MDNNICRCRSCNGIVHEVVKGDTLYLLGKKYNVSVSMIIKANRGINPYNLLIGEKICIPINRYSDYARNNDSVNNDMIEELNGIMDRNISEGMNERMDENMNGRMNERMDENMNDRINESINEKYDMEFEEIHEAGMISRDTELSDIINAKNMTVGKFVDIIKNI